MILDEKGTPVRPKHGDRPKANDAKDGRAVAFPHDVGYGREMFQLFPAKRTRGRASADDNRNVQREGIHVAASKRDSAANVFWTFGVAIKNGKLGALKALIREMSDAAQASEPGTLIYEWTISGDEKSAEVHERYADSDAALRHLASFNAKFADRLMALVQPTGMTI